MAYLYLDAMSSTNPPDIIKEPSGVFKPPEEPDGTFNAFGWGSAIISTDMEALVLIGEPGRDDVSGVETVENIGRVYIYAWCGVSCN